MPSGSKTTSPEALITGPKWSPGPEDICGTVVGLTTNGSGADATFCGRTVSDGVLEVAGGAPVGTTTTNFWLLAVLVCSTMVAPTGVLDWKTGASFSGGLPTGPAVLVCCGFALLPVPFSVCCGRLGSIAFWIS